MPVARRVLALSRGLPLPDCGEPPDGIVLRSYEPRDWPEFVRLDMEAAIASGQAYHTSPSGFSADGWLKQRQQFFRQTPEGPDPINWTIIILAEESGQVIAQISWLGLTLPKRNVLEITSIGVHSSHRRSGLASFLIKYAGKCAAPFAVSNIVLHVSADNGPAKCFYESLGFAADRWDEME